MLLTKKDIEIIEYFVSHTVSRRAAYLAVRPEDGQGQADKFWRRPEVVAGLEDWQKLTLLNRIPTPGRLIDRCMTLIEFNIGKFIRVTDSGSVVYDFTDATEDDWWAIQELKVQTLGRAVKRGEEPLSVEKLEFKTTDRLKTLQLLKEILSLDMFNASESGGNDTAVDVLKKLADRLPG